MICWFHRAAYPALRKEQGVHAKDVSALEPRAELWYRNISAVFQRAYLAAVKSGGLIPEDRGELQTLLPSFLLDKAIYELGYEMNNRPDRVVIPVRGIRYFLESMG